MSPAGASLPIVLVPVGTDEDALDACLAALDAGTPAGTRVWLADDAQAGPRAGAIIERWLASTRLQAAHTRRAAPIGEAAHIDQALRACAGADVVVLAGDACPAPGWLERLAGCAARDPGIGTATPWCNAGEVAAWPRIAPSLRDEKAEARFERIRALVGAVREVRAQRNVPPKRAVTLHLPAAIHASISQDLPFMRSLPSVLLEAVTTDAAPATAAAFMFEGTQCHLSNLADAGDAGAERARLEKAVADLSRTIDTLIAEHRSRR